MKNLGSSIPLVSDASSPLAKEFSALLAHTKTYESKVVALKKEGEEFEKQRLTLLESYASGMTYI